MPDTTRTLDAASFAVSILKSPRIRLSLGISFLLITVPFYTFIVRAPSGFPAQESIDVPRGATLREVAESFEGQRVVRSSFWLQNFVVLFGGERGVHAGEYFFEKPKSVVSVAWALARGEFGFDLVRVTVPEGTAVADIPSYFSNKSFTRFSRDGFARAATGEEGYLFPDTYLFPANVSAGDVVDAMRRNFEDKYARVERDARAFGKPKSDIVTMASLLEEEARTTESRRTIAGILWKRLEAGMPLQVDAVFPFILGKNTYQLTTEDLTFDSPYNTYRYRGLPPGPITNPGLDALTAAVTPIATPYLYYLSDREGNMHYAKTFEEHVENKERYLH